MTAKNAFGIGELAKETGVKAVTIRYYEQIGLMPPPPRTAGNYRSYSQSSRQRLRFIRRCRDLGFTIEEIRDLLRLSSERTRDCGEVERIAKQHQKEVEAKLQDLKRLLLELRRISTCCRGNRPIADCRIIEALSASA